ncbi:MAG TPA: flavin reductase family protein [Methyloradius sp.]
MKRYNKKDFPIEDTRRLLEPGPIVLVSSAYKGERDIMAMGWHMMMEYTLIGCYIWDQNYSRQLIRNSRECVINVPTADIAKIVIGIGNCHGVGIDKFEKFSLTATKAKEVSAPLIAECYASFECKLIDDTLIDKYSLFVFEVVKAHVATRPKYPETIHYRGHGQFMLSGKNKNYQSQFKEENL